jgi:hypothetical protein
MQAAIKRVRRVTLRVSDAAKKLGAKFCDQLLDEGVRFADATKIMRALLFRQAVVRNGGVRKKAAEQLSVDRKHLIDVFRSDSTELFPEDVEAELARLRQSRKSST